MLGWLSGAHKLKTGKRRSISNLLLPFVEDPIGGASLGAKTVGLWANAVNSLGFCIPKRAKRLYGEILKPQSALKYATEGFSPDPLSCSMSFWGLQT